MNKGFKYVIVIIIAICAIFFVSGLTYAVYTERSEGNSVIDLTTKNLSSIVKYVNNGEFTGSLNVGNDYSSGIRSDVIFYNSDLAVGLKGNLYLNLIDIPDGFNKESAFKWSVVRDGVVLSEGNFIGYNKDDSIVVYGPFELDGNKSPFEVYVWIDSSVYVNNVDLMGDNLKLSIKAFAYQKEMDG